MNTAISVANASVLTAFFSTLTFLLGYSALARWWRSPIGRAVASLDGALLLALLPSALHQLLGLNLRYVWFAWYYAASLFLVSAITLWRLRVIWTVQREGAGLRDRKRDAATPQDD